MLKDEKYLKNDPVAAAYFYKPDGSPVDVGSTLRNPAFADVLRQIARKGSSALLQGPVAQAIVTKVQSHPTNPGKLALSDLAGYQAKNATQSARTTALPARPIAFAACRHRVPAPSPWGRFWAF